VARVVASLVVSLCACGRVVRAVIARIADGCESLDVRTVSLDVRTVTHEGDCNHQNCES
jgi:hypothetical protein